MNIKVEIWDTSDKNFDIRNADKLVARMEVKLNVSHYINLQESPEWLKFYNMIKGAYSGPYIEITFCEKTESSSFITRC